MELDNSIKSHIIQIQEAARQNRLVIFVGAGVSASAGVPIWHELIEMFKKELPENLYDHNDILKSAQIYRELRGEVEYLKQIKKILSVIFRESPRNYGQPDRRGSTQKFRQLLSNTLHRTGWNG